MAQDVNKPQQRERKPSSGPDKRYTAAAGAKSAGIKPAQPNKPQAAHQPRNTKRKPSSPAGAPSSAEAVRVGDRIIVTIKRIGINGEGVGYYRRKAVFIAGALPDEVVKAKITKV